jgi:hypothetical protein
MSNMKNECSTWKYEISHRKSPRGRGYWAFQKYGESDPKNIFFANGTYAEAKKIALAHFKTDIEVLP